MNLGPLNKRVVIQTPSTARDSVNQLVPGWDDVATVWASIFDVTGREYVAAAGIQNAVTTKITIRYRSDVVAKMRVVIQGVAYTIESILGQDHIGLMLMCRRAD